jgi:polar amino acid transport system substrate-binding protein
MRVGYLVWNPTVIKDPQSGKLSGIYPNMVAEIARALNVKMSWHETTLANFAAGLQSNQFDFSVGPTFITIPRALAVSFTQPVAYVGNAAVVRADGNFHPSTISDLNTPGIRIAVLQGQALEEYCRRNVPKAELVVISGGDLTAPLVAVSSGRADIGLMNSVTVAQYTADHPEVKPVL